MRIHRMLCKGCGKKWEIGLPCPSNCPECGDTHTKVIQRLIRYCNEAYCDGEMLLNTNDAARLLGIDEAVVVDLCEKGLINSMLDWTTRGEPLRTIFRADVEEYAARGPNRLMTFEEALAHIALPPVSAEPDSNRLARRPSWPAQSAISRMATFLTPRPPVTRAELKSQMSARLLAKRNRQRQEISEPPGVALYASYPSLLVGPYHATDDDKRASDWFELRV